MASSLVDHLSAPNQRSQTQALDKIRYESITDPDKIEAGSASAGSNPLRHVGSQIRVYRIGLLLSSSSSREKSWSSEGLALTGCCREAVRSGSDRRQAKYISYHEKRCIDMPLNCRRSPTSSSKLLGPFRFRAVGRGMHRVGLLCRIDARDSSLSGCGLFEYASEIIPGQDQFDFDHRRLRHRHDQERFLGL